MMKQASVPISYLEKILNFPEGVHIGGIQHVIAANAIHMLIADPNNVFQQDMAYEPDKGWVPYEVKGPTTQ
jgi:hypothetical protein